MLVSDLGRGSQWGSINPIIVRATSILSPHDVLYQCSYFWSYLWLNVLEEKHFGNDQRENTFDFCKEYHFDHMTKSGTFCHMLKLHTKLFTFEIELEIFVRVSRIGFLKMCEKATKIWYDVKVCDWGWQDLSKFDIDCYDIFLFYQIFVVRIIWSVLPKNTTVDQDTTILSQLSVFVVQKLVIPCTLVHCWYAQATLKSFSLLTWKFMWWPMIFQYSDFTNSNRKGTGYFFGYPR